MKIELKQIRHYERLSEETNCFSAFIYVDGIKCASAENRGVGGNTDVWPLDIKYKEIVKQADEFCKTLPPYVFSDGDTMPYTLESLVDELLEKHLNEKHKEKQAKKMEKLFNNAIVLGNDREYYSIKFEISVADFIAKYPNQLKEYISKFTKKHEGKGYRILNNNIPQSFLYQII